ncbi:MAG: molybdenum ABC transporter ATP-binding protein [Acidobacteria bacterium]|nr:MAG: molybdenum ABC transporter ATP-binding protein [Acidobacteriota bacterium]
MLDVAIKKQFASNGRPCFALDAAFTANRGITVLFGASGSGKTTTLRSIAGMVTPDAGRISLGDVAYFDSAARINLAMQKRRVGFVFQDYLLFPHLTAAENVAYGVKGRHEHAHRRRVEEVLNLVGVDYAAGRRPDQLSGGEQQRVALARAIASDPAVLLLDEPLSAVDVVTRSRLLDEIIEVQRKTAIPFLYVTHSPADAVRIGDSLLVMAAGSIVQQGAPLEVFNAPLNVPAARVVGTENVLVGRIARHQPEDGISIVDLGGCRMVIPQSHLAEGSRVTLGIRAEDIIISRERIGRTSARNLLAGTVRHLLRDEGSTELVADCGVNLKVRITPQAGEALELAPGVEIYLLIKASSCHILP